jgi:hypothetical protein
MNNFPHCSVKKVDVERCLTTVEICDNVMQCPCCCYFLDKLNTKNIEIIVDSLVKLPEKITLIQIPLLPTPANRTYFSFDGLETIIYNLFKSQNKKHIVELKKGGTYLKVYYKKDPLFTLPIIMIEVIFFRRLHEKSFDEILNTLKAEVLYFTGSVGDIDVKEIYDIEDLIKILHVPLIIGHPEFKNEGVLKHHKFREDQIQEMNYIHSISIQKLDMGNVVNNNQIFLFKDQREAILNDLNKEKGEIDKAISAIFNIQENEEKLEDLIDLDNLPF